MYHINILHNQEVGVSYDLNNGLDYCIKEVQSFLKNIENKIRKINDTCFSPIVMAVKNNQDCKTSEPKWKKTLKIIIIKMLTLLRSKTIHIASSTLSKAAEILKRLVDNVNLTEEFDLIHKKLINSVVIKLWWKYKVRTA